MSLAGKIARLACCLENALKASITARSCGDDKYAREKAKDYAHVRKQLEAMKEKATAEEIKEARMLTNAPV